MMIKLDEAKLAAQQALWVVFSRGKIVVQESSESIPVAYLSDIPFLASYIDEIHQLPPLNETAHRDLPVYVVDLGAEHVDEPGWERVSLRQLLFAEYDIAFSVIGRAWQYIHFLRTHQFWSQCPRFHVEAKSSMPFHLCCDAILSVLAFWLGFRAQTLESKNAVLSVLALMP